MNFTDGLQINESLVITVFSMLLVFAALIVISYSIDILKVIFHGKDSKKKVAEVQQPASVVVEPTRAEAEDDDEELVAVITAALAASLSRPASEIVVRNIVRVSQNTPVWARVGRQEQFNLK